MSKARVLSTVLFLIFITTISLWIIPYRLATEPGASYYNFSYVTDECVYAQHLAPLMEKTNDANWSNGFSENTFTPQFYLEMLLRRMLTVTGVSAITLFWIWRLAFPIAMGASLLLMTATCLRRTDKHWHRAMVFVAAAAVWPLFYFIYDCIMPFFPMHAYLDRIPTNIEFVLTVLLFAVFVFFLRKPELPRALIVIAMLTLLTYARPYSVVGCGPPVALTVLYLSLRGVILWRTTLLSGMAFLILLLPMLWHMHLNGLSPEYQTWLARYFSGAGGYQVHSRWPVHLAVAAVLAVAGWRLRNPWRAFVVSLALTAAAAPFISGMMPLRVQMLNIYDRWGSLFVPALLLAGLFLVAQASESWRGHAGHKTLIRWLRGLAAAALVASAAVAARTAVYNFDADRNSNHLILKIDADCVSAYKWVAANTAGDALFLVDDGLDWSKVEKDVSFRTYAATLTWDRAEMFMLVARRRCVYTERLYVNSISTTDLHNATMLHYGTFGMTMPVATYVESLKHFRPDYVFWRRTSPIPRGFGAQLQKLATVVYSDACCEIWKLRYE